MPLEQAQLRMAEPLPQPATQPAGAATGARASPSGTFELHVQGADLRGVLHVLSTQGHKSIVATKEVTGTVTADLYGVTFPQALEAILKAQGFVYREKDGIISVYTPQQLEEVIRAEREGGRTKVVTEVLVPPTTGPSTQAAGARATVEGW
jgi:type II secretory pathway component HofQ